MSGRILAVSSRFVDGRLITFLGWIEDTWSKLNSASCDRFGDFWLTFSDFAATLVNSTHLFWTLKQIFQNHRKSKRSKSKRGCFLSACFNHRTTLKQSLEMTEKLLQKHTWLTVGDTWIYFLAKNLRKIQEKEYHTDFSRSRHAFSNRPKRVLRYEKKCYRNNTSPILVGTCVYLHITLTHSKKKKNYK